MAALTLAPWQWGVIALVWVVFFLLPAVWIGRKAKADGDAPFLWVLLTLVGSILGPLEYYEHRAVLKRRAKRAERAKTGSGPSEPRER
jgi:hypothetical protein